MHTPTFLINFACVEHWYKEAKDKGLTEVILRDRSYIAYKGIKIVKNKLGYFVYDCKGLSDDVLIEDTGFLNIGFIKGCDLLQHENDVVKVEVLKILLDEQAARVRRLEKEIKARKAPLKKKRKELERINKSMRRNKDDLIRHNCRRHQIEVKYNIKSKLSWD